MSQVIVITIAQCERVGECEAVADGGLIGTRIFRNILELQSIQNSFARNPQHTCVSLRY